MVLPYISTSIEKGEMGIWYLTTEYSTPHYSTYYSDGQNLFKSPVRGRDTEHLP